MGVEFGGEEIVKDLDETFVFVLLFEREGEEDECVGDGFGVFVDLAETEGVDGGRFGLGPVGESAAEVGFEEEGLLDGETVGGFGDSEFLGDLGVDGGVEIGEEEFFFHPVENGLGFWVGESGWGLGGDLKYI